jgi:hypothetical protein
MGRIRQKHMEIYSGNGQMDDLAVMLWSKPIGFNSLAMPKSGI